MAACVIYLDESGDLGWKFDQPYRRGGSSRYLTIASLLVPAENRNPPKRLVRKLYRKHKWPTSEEKKWVGMLPPERLAFANAAANLREKHPDIRYFAITVQKERVAEHIRKDRNKLYNYMIRLSLVKEMAKWDAVTFVPDPRSVKVASGNSLHDYLVTTLWFDHEAKTTLSTRPAESDKSLAIQFVDMLAGAVWAHHENGNSDPWGVLAPHVSTKQLFFR